jgi:hypothetical protein
MKNVSDPVPFPVLFSLYANLPAALNQSMSASGLSIGRLA